ncbi:YwmB family TATA-box binding protein [Alkalithermobacter paradoxus]|uniref:TATA-box binding protein n=1 Tax=Alkalithermobacter paradoxus TaxID=29349 RepID=A0A1V4I848_9FIRM|nr:hypothetical protein CLOTH_12520 [[Clostridium] thermoalcaliphilum]
MKRLFCFAIILVLFVSILSISQAQGESGYDELLNVFNKTNSNFESYSINGHVELSNKFLEFEEMKSIINKLNIIYGINSSDLEYVQTEQEGFRQVYTHTGNGQGENVSVIVQSQLSENVEETHIIVDIRSNEVYKSIVNNYKKMKDVLSEYSSLVDIYTCISGSFDGKIEDEQYDIIASDIFSKLSANESERAEDENFISLTGYTKKIKEHITYAGKKVNLNVSVRYSDYEDKTYIYIGTPLIALEY